MTNATIDFQNELVNQIAHLNGTATIVSEIGTFVTIDKNTNECWIGNRRLVFATLGQIVDATLLELGYRLTR